MMGGAVKALESRQVWSAFLALTLAVLQAAGVHVPAPIPAILYAALAAVFGEASAQKILAVHAAHKAVAAAAVVPAKGPTVPPDSGQNGGAPK
jgi:hypothetical protein